MTAKQIENMLWAGDWQGVHALLTSHNIYAWPGFLAPDEYEVDALDVEERGDLTILTLDLTRKASCAGEIVVIEIVNN